MGKEVARNMELAGPSISGTVIVEWRNLEDFRGIIHQEEHDKVHEEILQGVRLAQKLEDEIVAKEKTLAKTYSDLTEVKRVNGELILAGEELKKEVESLKADNELWRTNHNDCMEDLKLQTSLSDGINERLKLALKETDYWKNKKSIWFRWFGL